MDDIFIRGDRCKFWKLTSLNEFSAATLASEHLGWHLCYRGHCCCYLRPRKVVQTFQGDYSIEILNLINLTSLPSFMVYPQLDRVVGSVHGGLD